MKMETPKMDVVRFQEADVLAASNEHRYLKIAGLGDSVEGKATWTYTNGHESTRNFADYAEEREAGTLRGEVSYTNASGNVATLGSIIAGGDAVGSFVDFNGDYETFDQGASWVWRTN